jgi:hypothetical protein
MMAGNLDIPKERKKAENLEIPKERKKYEKKLREIASLEKSSVALTKNQVAKINMKADYLDYLVELDVAEHGLRKPHIRDVSTDAKPSQVKDAHVNVNVIEQPEAAVAKATQVKDAHNDVNIVEQPEELCELKTLCKTDEGELLQLKRQRKAMEEERKKLQRRQGQMATQADRDRRSIGELKSTIESLFVRIEAQGKDFTQQFEDLSQRHAKEKSDLMRGNEQLKKTVSCLEGRLERMRKSVANHEMLAEEEKVKAQERQRKLQDVIEAKGLLYELERQKAESKKMSVTLDRQKQKIEMQMQEVAELSSLQDELQEGRNAVTKLAAKIEELCEERRRAAETVSHDLFQAGHHLKAFLHALEPELQCPITYELPDEPSVAADGHLR